LKTYLDLKDINNPEVNQQVIIQEKEYHSYWSEDGQIYFCDGKGYGLTDSLHTICLGSEKDIKSYLNTGQFANGFNQLQRQVLSQIFDFRKEQGIGQSTASAGAAGMERAVHYGPSRGKPQATRLSQTRKRLPLRPPRTKNQGLYGQ
jgi:hypothetical protein